MAKLVICTPGGMAYTVFEEATGVPEDPFITRTASALQDMRRPHHGEECPTELIIHFYGHVVHLRVGTASAQELAREIWNQTRVILSGQPLLL